MFDGNTVLHRFIASGLDMDVSCNIELFGGLRVLQGDRVVTRFRTQKTASLLAYSDLLPTQDPLP